MLIDGVQISNREAWIEGARSFLAARFQDEANGEQEQQTRVSTFESLALAARLGGYGTKPFSIWEVVRARGNLSENTGVGEDGIPAEL